MLSSWQIWFIRASKPLMEIYILLSDFAMWRYLNHSLLISPHPFSQMTYLSLLFYFIFFGFPPIVWYQHLSPTTFEFTPESFKLKGKRLSNKGDSAPRKTQIRDLWLRMKEYLPLHLNPYCYIKVFSQSLIIHDSLE